jgi:hypothetical protein
MIKDMIRGRMVQREKRKERKRKRVGEQKSRLVERGTTFHWRAFYSPLDVVCHVAVNILKNTHTCIHTHTNTNYKRSYTNTHTHALRRSRLCIWGCILK